MTTRPLYLSRERFSEPVATHLEEGVRSGKLQREQVDRLAAQYHNMHQGMPRDDMRQSLVSFMQNIKPQKSHFKTLQALRYGLSHFEGGPRLLEEEIPDKKMGFERHGGLGIHMLEDLGVKPGQHAHTTYSYIRPNGPRKLGLEEEDQMTEVLGDGRHLLERLARHAGRQPEEMSETIDQALKNADVSFRGTQGEFHGVDVVRKDDAVVLHVHSIHRIRPNVRPQGPEHTVIPIGKQSLTFAREVRDYLQEATGQTVPRLKTQ